MSKNRQTTETNPAQYRFRPQSSMFALEPRIMFDAAAAGDLADLAEDLTTPDNSADNTADDSLNVDDVADALAPAAYSEATSTSQSLRDATPVHFEANEGQFDSSVDYVARGENYTMFVTNSEVVMNLKDANSGETSSLRMSWTGGNDAASAVTGIEKSSAISNYIIGSDQSKWVTGVENYNKVMLENVYEGVDLVVYGSSEGQLEYDFVADSGADISQIGIHFEGAESLAIDADGNLNIQTDTGMLTQQAPIAYQLVDGERTAVESSFVLGENNTVTFDVGNYDTSQPLYIDPILHYSTYLGSSAAEDWLGGGIAVDGSGNAYVTGTVSAADFPTKGSAESGVALGGTDAIVTMYDPNGLIVYSTYLGGSGDDYGKGIAVDSAGIVYVTGHTQSADIATFAGNPNQSQIGDGTFTEAFVNKLNTSGVATYGTYLGGSDADTTANDIVVDGSGNFYIVGSTAATTGAGFDITTGAGSTDAAAYNAIEGATDAYVTRFDAAGAITYSSYLGGELGDQGYGVGVDGSGNFYIAGVTSSTLLNVQNQTQLDQTGADYFVAGFNANGTLNYSTYLGGSGTEQTGGNMLHVDSSGNAFVVGGTDSADFFTQNATQAANAGGIDGTLTKFDNTGSVIFSTYFGGTGDDIFNSVTVDANDYIYAVGETTSADITHVDPVYDTNAGGKDGLIVKFDNSATNVFSTYAGGQSDESIRSVAVDSNESIHFFGDTQSDDFPLQSAEQGTFADTKDYFVSKLTKNAAPVLTDPTDLALTTLQEDPATNNGDLISDIVASSITDVDNGAVEGIAIVGVTETANGTWEYTTDGGTTWTDVGTVDETQALLLADDISTKLRFNPNAEWGGQASVTFRAWDQTDGLAEATKTNISINGRGTAFSADRATATIDIISVAEPPTVTNSITDEDTVSTSGLVITPDAADGGDVTHYLISNIVNGTLYLADGTTQVNSGSYITVGQGAAGLKWSPDGGTVTNGAFDVQASLDGATPSSSVVTATITINPVADTPTITDSTTAEDVQTSTGLVLTRNAQDGAEVSHYKVTGITNGTLYQADGVTQITNGTFITALEGAAGLRFTPSANSNADGTFDVQASTGSDDTGLGGSVVTATVTVTAVPDDAVVTNAETDEDVMTTSGLVISRSPNDGAEVSHFKITNITSGTVYLNDGVTQVNAGDFITAAQGAQGLRFLSAQDSFVDGTFDVQASTAADDTGLGGTVTTAAVTVNPVADTPTITPAQTLEDIQTDDGLVISRNVVDGTEVTHFKISNISGGHLYFNDGETEISNGDFITFSQGNSGLKFTGLENSFTPGTFDVQASISGDDTGVGGAIPSATITIDPVADTPTGTDADATGVVQTESGLVLSRNPADSNEVTHFYITNVTNGTLYLSDGQTTVGNNSFITIEQGQAGLRFTPSPRVDGYFDIQGSVSNNASGVGDAPHRINIKAPVFPSIGATSNQIVGLQDHPTAAEQRTNNMDYLDAEATRGEVQRTPPSNETAQEKDYQPSQQNTLFQIKQSAIPGAPRSPSANNNLVLSDTVFQARMTGTTGAVSSSFMSLLDGTAYNNPDVGQGFYGRNSGLSPTARAPMQLDGGQNMANSPVRIIPAPAAPLAPPAPPAPPAADVNLENTTAPETADLPDAELDAAFEDARKRRESGQGTMPEPQNANAPAPGAANQPQPGQAPQDAISYESDVTDTIERTPSELPPIQGIDDLQGTGPELDGEQAQPDGADDMASLSDHLGKLYNQFGNDVEKLAQTLAARAG